MAKVELKTKQTEASVDDFLNKIEDENVRQDCQTISKMMGKVTDAKPKMWGENIIGFGEQHLKYASGRELDWMKIGFSPRKANITLYLNIGNDWNEELLAQLGKHKLGKGCLYIKRLKDIDENVLVKLIEESAKI